MSETTHVITDAPDSKTTERRKRVQKVVAYGVFAAGCILLIDDAVKFVSSKVRAKKHDEKTDTN